MKEKQLKRTNFKLIELELYCYHESKRELELLRESILEGSSQNEDGIRGSGISDVTGNKAIKLASSKELLEIERRLRAIEESLDIIKQDPQRYELLKMKYFDKKYTDTWIWMELDMSDRTFYRWRREIIELIGSRLGWRV